jgi:gamma-glutamyltranspeptidase/glutathione hydrolase
VGDSQGPWGGSPTRAALVAVGVLATLSCLPARPADPRPDIGASDGTRGVVSSAHPLATQAGVAVLESGGNAFDAAVAVAAALNVVEPMMSGMGGYGTILVWDAAAGRARFLNASGRFPALLDSDAFRPPTPGWAQSRFGAKGVSTPGNVNAWDALWREYGSLPWPDLFEDAIRLASEGFEVSPRTASMIAAVWKEIPAHAREIYGRQERPLTAGERLVQQDLARSLAVVARAGAAAVHGGELGVAIDAAMREGDGFLRLRDLRDQAPEWWEPIAIEYRGYQIVTASPPANAFDALVRIGTMGQFDLRALGHNSAGYLHRFAEVTKQAFALRLRWAGDPGVRPPPLQTLLDSSFWVSQAREVDMRRATPFAYPDAMAAGSPQIDGHTTHFVVADRHGNVVSATQTLGGLFGSRIMPRGTGIWLNNSLAYSTFEPKGNPMDAVAGRRKLSGDVPTLILHGGRPWAALGTPGGHTIGQTVPQVVLNLLDFSMPIEAALAAPRVAFLEPDTLGVEQSVPSVVRDSLSSMGHLLRVSRGFGNVHALRIEYGRDGAPTRFRGAADPRGEGRALGVDRADLPPARDAPRGSPRAP